jgi:hypothetical protein
MKTISFWGQIIDLPMEPKILGLLIAVLFFLISLLLNLLQRRYSKARLHRMLLKDISVLNFLMAINKYLGKLERNCILELHGASSPQEVGKGIHTVRNRIESTIAAMGEHLSSFRQYRRKRKFEGKKVKKPAKSHQKPAGG